MKTFRQLFYLLIGALFISCSSDDNITKEIIVGNWVEIKYVEVYDDNTETVFDHNCEPPSIWNFKIDGKVETINQSCTNGDIEAFWSKLPDSGYQFNYKNITYNTTGYTDTISFPNENTMKLIYNAGYQYQGKYFLHSYYEYIRQN